MGASVLETGGPVFETGVSVFENVFDELKKQWVFAGLCVLTMRW